MGFREDVPLDGFINMTPFASEVLITPPMSGVTFGGSPSFFAIGPPQEEDVPLYLRPLRSGGQGPVVRSTSLELEPWPSVVWDVNGYYHALGVGFRATRKQLRIAYDQLNGQESDYLTYVFKQLLNEETRRTYDAAPFGGKFLDKYVEMDLKQLAKVLAERFKRDEIDILEEWGFVVERGLDEMDSATMGTPGEPLDIPQETQEDEAIAPADEPESDLWPYSYYLWKVRLRHCALNFPSIMQQWQEAIVAECQRRKVATRFAVGLTSEGRKENARFLTMSVDGTTVVFISADHIDDIEDIAPHAVHRLTHLRD